MWLWGLVLILAGGALAMRRRRPPAFVLLFFALCTLALGAVIFSACSAYAPLSMGLPTSISATAETTQMCLGKDALQTAFLWTVIVVVCCAAAGLFFGARLSSTNAARRTFAYIGSGLLLLLAIACVLLWIFGFMLCSSTWVY
jgi:uncharacterized membrane protein